MTTRPSTVLSAQPRRSAWRALLCVPLAMAVAPLATGCSDDEPTTPPAPIVGTWNATSISAIGQDFIAQGMTLTATFATNGSYTVAVTGDLIGACNPGPDCTASGTYSSTATQVTLDPGTADAVTFNYLVSGTTLMLTGSIEAIPVTIMLSKA